MGLVQCETYEQVLEQARRNEARRRQMFAACKRPVAIVGHAPKPEPVSIAKPVRRQIGPIYVFPGSPEWEAYTCTLPLEAPRKRPMLKDIVRYVAHKRDVSVLDMMSARRTAHVARARQIVMYLAKKLTPLSLPAIGKQLAGKDHTTIMHGIRKVELLRADADFDAEIAGYLKELGEPE